MQQNERKKIFFTDKLLDWHHSHNDRSLPWKEEKDPYKIWLSEIILQQTRAAQGLPYYLRFTESYPSITDMANAVDEDVFRLWQGLGYYNRCRNLLATARLIRDNFGGVFPKDYETIISLKGVGTYTAAAIASFAYNLPHAVVDGNVYRVLSRFFGIDTPTDSKEGKILFANLASELLDVGDSAAYNQSIMDFGATVCKPANPLCSECPLQINCTAFHNNLTNLLPVKNKKIQVKERYFQYIVLLYKDEIWIKKRTEKDIWQNLHEPFLIETETPEAGMDILIKKISLDFNILKLSIKREHSLTQRLTHQNIHTNFYVGIIDEKPLQKGFSGEWIKIEDIKKIAFPKTIISFFEKSDYFYTLR